MLIPAHYRPPSVWADKYREGLFLADVSSLTVNDVLDTFHQDTLQHSLLPHVQKAPAPATRAGETLKWALWMLM